MTEIRIGSSFWADSVHPSRGGAVTELSKRADVVVIGAGYTGLSAAFALARRGASVTVIETNHVGWGASSRNGGMVLGGLKLPVDVLIARHGLDRARRMFAASLGSIDHVERLVRDERIACGFRRSGHLELACKPAHLEAFRRSSTVLAAEFGHVVRVVEGDALAAEIGSTRYFGGRIDERSAGLNPAAFALGLAAAAERYGTAIVERCEVKDVAKQRQGAQR